MVSMKDIARLCDVSEATVSKALSGKPGVGEEVRQRVVSAAKRFNYVPNALVKGIQSGFTRTIAVNSSCKYESSFGWQIMKGLDAAIVPKGYSSVLGPLGAGSEFETQAGLIRNFSERWVDGMVMIGHRFDDPMTLRELRAFRGVVVVLDQEDPAGEFDFVGSDDRAGAELAAEYLLSLGHRDIAYIGDLRTSTARNRLDGLRTVMAVHGLPLRAEWICDVEEDAACTEAARLLGNQERPTAFMCFNDSYALDVVSAAYDTGVRIPEDVSVVGFGNLSFASKVRPTITTVEQHPAKMGEFGGELLIKRIEVRKKLGRTETDSVKPERITIPCELVLRGSALARGG